MPAFGIGCLLAETEGESLVDTMSTANSVTSDLDCSSPESIMDPSNLAPTGDQYSLGCVMYYMLAGQYPFPDGSAAEKMMAHQLKEPQPLAELTPDAPPEVIAVIERLMQKKPEDRYTAVAEIVEELRPFASKASGVKARPVAKPSAKAEAPKTTSPSASTPRPQAMGILPTRNSIRNTTQAAAPKPAPQPEKSQAPAESPAQLAVPGGAVEIPQSFWEGNMGPVGVFFTAMIACGIGYVAFKLFN